MCLEVIESAKETRFKIFWLQGLQGTTAMGWKVVFKPKPRCLRDKLELWFVGPRRPQFYYANLAGLFPFAGMLIGALIGLVISFVIDSNANTSWGDPQRYVPLLLCSGVTAIIGFLITGAIIDGYYEEHSPFLENEETIERIRTRSSSKSTRKGTRKRRRSSEDDD